MTINELYAEYRRSRDENTLVELVGQAKRYCGGIHKRRRRTFWAVSRETALEIAEEQALRCARRCLDKEVLCFKRCLSSKFMWRMTDHLKKLIDEPKVIGADEIRAQLGIERPDKVSEDEAISSLAADLPAGPESQEHLQAEKWLDLERHLRDLPDLEAQVFRLSFSLSAEQVAEILGTTKEKVARAKCSAKKKLMAALAGGE